MSNLAEVKQRARSLVEDDDGDFCTDGYLTPKINQAYGMAIGMLEDSSLNPFTTEVLDLPAFPAGTTSFIDAMGPGKQWEGLDNPLRLEVKQVGQPVEYYREVPIVEVLPNVSPISNLTVGILDGGRVGAAEWRGNELFVTPFEFDVDARLRGDFRPAKLVQDTDRIKVHYEMTEHLSFATAALIGIARGNSGWTSEYGSLASAVLDRIASKLTKQTQSAVLKFGRKRRR